MGSYIGLHDLEHTWRIKEECLPHAREWCKLLIEVNTIEAQKRIIPAGTWYPAPRLLYYRNFPQNLRLRKVEEHEEREISGFLD